MSVHGPVHYSWVSFGCTPSLCKIDLASRTNTKSPFFTWACSKWHPVSASDQKRGCCLCSCRRCRSSHTTRISQSPSRWLTKVVQPAFKVAAVELRCDGVDSGMPVTLKTVKTESSCLLDVGQAYMGGITTPPARPGPSHHHVMHSSANVSCNPQVSMPFLMFSKGPPDQSR